MLKVGIIGCGKITEVRHAPEYAENHDVELVAFYDIFPEKAQAMANKYGGKAYSTIDELLSSDIDAVSVCTANFDHASSTIKALKAGKHVLCEKPMATILTDCEAMLDEAEKAGKLLMLGHNQRFSKAHVKAREIIESGMLGKILAFRTTFGHPGPEGWTGQANSWFFDKAKSHFGAMADLGVHKTDLIHFLLGEPIVEVYARIGTLDKRYPDGTLINVDDNAFCLYTTASGAIGSMHVSWTFYGEEDNSTRIYGTKGILRLYDDPSCSLIFEKKNGEIQHIELDKLVSNKEQTSGGRVSTGVIDHFVDSILGRTTCRIDGREAFKAMRVVFAAEESARSGKTISLTL
jgi:predicted dehydrogenase